jgi:hypothetical protein
MPELPAILDAIREQPDDGPRQLALAWRPWDNGLDDVRVAARGYWPILHHNLGVASLDATLGDMAQNDQLRGPFAPAVYARQ